MLETRSQWCHKSITPRILINKILSQFNISTFFGRYHTFPESK
uniref:Uncharacterized protein n=1 Tax=Populus trichocarpa x Populus deltoides TaxID=3695 RepID=A9PK37_9ROSI|nr:unknown [Populus trichocarpa x Populus deltoides]